MGAHGMRPDTALYAERWWAHACSPQWGPGGAGWCSAPSAWARRRPASTPTWWSAWPLLPFLPWRQRNWRAIGALACRQSWPRSSCSNVSLWADPAGAAGAIAALSPGLQPERTGDALRLSLVEAARLSPASRALASRRLLPGLGRLDLRARPAGPAAALAAQPAATCVWAHHWPGWSCCSGRPSGRSTR